jgi:hypothetical protein
MSRGNGEMRRIRMVVLRSSNSCKRAWLRPHEFEFERFDQGHQQQGRPAETTLEQITSARRRNHLMAVNSIWVN